MADDKSSQSESLSEQENSQEDPVKQVKTEFSRKIENINSVLAEQNRQMQAVIEALANSNKKPNSTQSDDDIDEDLVLNDPKKFAKQVREKAVNEATAAITKQTQQQQQVQVQESQALAALRSDYPELNDASSELAKKAIEIYNQNGSQGAIAVRAAVREAASELGLQSSKFRKNSSNSSDNFSVSGEGNTSGNTRAGDRSAKKSKVSENTLAFAQLLGRDVNDKKVMERIEKYSQRKNWKRYSKE